MIKTQVILIGAIGAVLIAGGGYWAKDRYNEHQHTGMEEALVAEATQAADDAVDQRYAECRGDLFRWYDSPAFQFQIVQDGHKDYIIMCKELVEAQDLGTDAEIKDCEHLLSTWNPSANRGTKTSVTEERLRYCENLMGD
ncbi:hypothetical protein [Paracoccus saliphilus]|uniref:Uncharacterized protein n=1 Tax=Paracoccus saliphilus TaxID=405559 RepID=A0AA45W8H9_9RHOB|nr:hypothetical protein [Paracoccus saliphilus]WCR02629.1 hypothetical protein JHX88_17495 [Paracoccus saliphilus]SIT17039.1 hypothetical protein SAMN05421772_1304 [Paracoccus saliphilus]